MDIPNHVQEHVETIAKHEQAFVANRSTAERLALTPYFNATRATEAPASSVSSTTRRRSPALRRRRGPALNPPLRSMSTIHTSSRLNTTLYTRPTPHAYDHRDADLRMAYRGS
jgi:hypothetical protein